jgi:hypothetical protein
VASQLIRKVKPVHQAQLGSPPGLDGADLSSVIATMVFMLLSNTTATSLAASSGNVGRTHHLEGETHARSAGTGQL